MSQRLILDAVQGPLKGATFSVPAGGTLLVGRLPECGISIAQDLTVSRQHCRIDYDPPDCRLTHLSQTSETLVNGESVKRSDLRRGDEITLGAGNTFRVGFDDRAPGASAGLGADRAAASTARKFAMSPASCGWTVFQGLEAQPGLRDVLGIVAKSQPVSAFVDLGRTGLTPPDQTEPHYLFPWFPPESRAQFSPLFLSQANCPNVVDLVEAGWGKDGIVCVGSSLKDADLLAHWRKLSGVEGEQPGKAMTAYHWPSLLIKVLTCQTSEQVAPLLTNLTWLLMEDPKAPGQWSLFADEKFASVLTSAGLVPADSTATIHPQS